MQPAYWALMAMVACGGGGGAGGDGTAPAPTGDTATPVVPTGDDDDVPTLTGDSGPSAAPGLWGRLIDADGAPLPHTDVQACSRLACLTEATRDDGSFAFDVAPGTAIAFKTLEDLHGDPPRGAALAPCVVPEGPPLALGDVYVPAMTDRVALAATAEQEVVFGSGLTLSIEPDALAPPFGVFLTELGAARIPDAYVPAYAGLDGEVVLHVYALAPFATSSARPVGLRVASDLPAGATAHARSVDYLDGTFSAPVRLTADGTSLSTAPGEGVTALTHLIITAPQ